MGDTISHLRTLARRPSSSLQAVEIKGVIENALALLDARLRESKITPIRTFPNEDIYVHAEAIRLEQVLINLLNNAIDAMGECATRELEMTIQPEKERVRILVSDTGVGISEENIDNIFDPRYRQRGFCHVGRQHNTAATM